MKEQYDFNNAQRGPVVPTESGTTPITLPIDNEVLAWFRDQISATPCPDEEGIKTLPHAVRHSIQQ
ncbi:MAG: hypothetical protein IT490_12465 [Candidatus Contendobacter sp.]|nr:hypothetical protein [Candidatus Contendobacter sp.]RUQ38579.1 MAG: hypothetical protein EKK69_12270 [Candidatus Competibacteraceae bacterium]